MNRLHLALVVLVLALLPFSLLAILAVGSVALIVIGVAKLVGDWRRSGS